MTTQEFVKKESEAYSEKVSFQIPYNGTNDFYNEERLKTSTIDFSDGLTKGLEIAEGFAEWVSISHVQTEEGLWRKYSNQTGVKIDTSELVERFSDYSNYYKRGETGFLEWSTREGETNAIQCAIICVEEIIAAEPSEPSPDGYYELLSDIKGEAKDFWQSVLNELKSRL